ncbi:Dehydration-responsive element-binding protein 1C [Euphorbia peplus]|nr:Dehydration-responsive element-binding protein 1C [Euphorbia peplus]
MDSPQFSDDTSGGGSFNSDEDIMCSLAINKPKRKMGRKIYNQTRHPIYRGVRQRNGNKWVCELREPNKKSRIWLGTYPTPEMAARAHDVAALALKGKSACLNFADSAWRLPVPESGDALEIKRVAGVAAEMFRPEEFGGCYRDEFEGSSEDVSEENWRNLEERNMFFNEEVFEMPRLIDEMAQGLLLSSPFVDEWNCLENDYNVSLWSY